MKRLALLLAVVAAGSFAQTAPTVPAGRGGRGAAAPPVGRGTAPAPAVDKAAPRPATAAAFTPRDLKYPPLHAVQPPKLVTATLPNGIRLYLSEQRELPVFGGVVMVRTGGVFDPPERIGLAALAGRLLRNGGTALKTGDQVEDLLTRLGMTLESSISETAGMVAFSGLKRNLDPSLALLREIVADSEFRQDRLEAVKEQVRNRIAHRNDDIPNLMRRELSTLMFGKDSPYGWQPDYTSLERITRSDIKAFHKRYFFPANTMVGIWGDFDAAQMQAAVDKVFGSWTAAQQPVPDFPKATATPAPGIYLAEKKDVPVSHIMMGQPGSLATQKDYPALEVMGLIFNQLQARLTRNARSLAGATNINLLGATVDDAKADWGAGLDHQGMFHLYGTCRGAATAEAIKAIRDDIERMRTTEVSEEELRIAKETAVTNLASNWDTYPNAFARAMTLEYYGAPRDFPQQYQAGVTAVTRADVLRVAKQYLNPAGLSTIVVGNPQVFSVPLDMLDPQINRIDLTIPEAKTLVTKSTDTSIAEGKRLLQRAAAAIGGAEKLLAVKDYLISSVFELDPSVPRAGGAKVPQSDRWIFPAIFRQEVALPTGRITTFSNGKSGWISAPQGWGALVGVQLKQLQSDLFRSYFRLFISDRIEGRTVNAVDQDLIEITDTTGQIARIEFDPQTGLMTRCTYDVTTQTGPLFTEETYSDYRVVDGIKIPFKTVITQAGQKFADVTVTEVKINSGLRQVDLALRPVQ